MTSGPGSRQGIATSWEDPWATRRAGLRRSIQRARWLQEDLDRGRAESAAALAAREELSRARVSQLLRLLRLAPAILEELDDATIHGAVPREADLRKLPDLQGEQAQLAAYRRLCDKESRKLQGRRVRPCRVVGRRGYAHLFERARRYHQALASKQVASIAALGRAEGVSAGRVGQILAMLYLAPDIIEQLEASDEALPGVTEKELRRIARIRDLDRQREEFAGLVAGGLAGR